jgi:hypothetical protein
MAPTRTARQTARHQPLERASSPFQRASSPVQRASSPLLPDIVFPPSWLQTTQQARNTHLRHVEEEEERMLMNELVCDLRARAGEYQHILSLLVLMLCLSSARSARLRSAEGVRV